MNHFAPAEWFDATPFSEPIATLGSGLSRFQSRIQVVKHRETNTYTYFGMSLPRSRKPGGSDEE
jgi:hypothetical protein